MGKIGEEYVTIEESVDGTFRKCVNNNGSVCDKGDRSALFDEAECLAHFTYEGSEKEVMLLDIQGCEYSLIYLEIASKELTPTDLLFCAGNLSANAISTFVTNQKCSSYLSTVRAFSIGVTSSFLAQFSHKRKQNSGLVTLGTRGFCFFPFVWWLAKVKNLFA